MTAAIPLSFDPRTGRSAPAPPTSTDAEIDAAAARAGAAADAVAAASPSERSGWLVAIADAIDSAIDELVEVADAETALACPACTVKRVEQQRHCAFMSRSRSRARGWTPRSTAGRGRTCGASIAHSGRWPYSGPATFPSVSASSGTTPPSRSRPDAPSWSRHIPRIRGCRRGWPRSRPPRSPRAVRRRGRLRSCTATRAARASSCTRLSPR